MRYVLLLIVLMFPGLLLAGAEPYGRNFVLAGAQWPSESGGINESVAPVVDEASARTLVDQLTAQLAEREFQEGPYAASIAETLGALARAQDSLGLPALAMGSRERALHLIRVNEGLYSPAQGPLVRDMLDSLRQQRDFEALDARYNYFYRLYGAGQPPWDRVRWTAMMEYLRWQREALRLEIDSQAEDRLLRLHALNSEYLQRIEDGAATATWEQRRDLVLSQLKTLYLIEDRMPPVEVFAQSRNEFVRPRDPLDFNLPRERLENIRRAGQGTGRDLLENLLEIIPVEETVARAEIELALADWLQWQGSVREARDGYEALWHRLEHSGMSDLALDWFQDPTPLPDNGIFYGPFIAEAESVSVVLSVSQSGRAEVLSADVASGRERSSARLRRYLSATRFRPAIREGRVIDSTGQRREFVVFQR
jgi:hypothetical protein